MFSQPSTSRDVDVRPGFQLEVKSRI